MKTNQKGFGVVGILLIVVLLGLVGGAGWYVWQSQKNDQNTNTTTKDSTQNDNQVAEPLVLAESELPVGWSAEIKESGRILLSNKETRCFTDVLYTADTAESNSPDVNHNKQTVDAIKSKGYSVQETRDRLTIMTSKGERQLDAQALQLTGLDNPMSQKYAYIAKSDSFTQIQLSCPSNSELPTAQAALSAVTFSKVD